MNYKRFVRDHPGQIKTRTPIQGKKLLDDESVCALVADRQQKRGEFV